MFDNIPIGLVPEYVNEVNKQITLYKGNALLHTSKGDMEGECHIYFSWTPFSCVRFIIKLPSTFWLPDLTKHYELHVSELKLCIKVRILSFNGGKSENTTSGIISNPIRIGKDTGFVRMTFHLANLCEMLGEGIKRGNTFSRGRINLLNGPWRITFDEVPEVINANGLTMREVLKEEKGFAITHFGYLERTDGKVFTSLEADELLTNLGRTMSFANSINTYPILRSGFNLNGEKIWQCWTGFVVHHFDTRSNWFSCQQPLILQSVFDGWQRLVSDPNFDIIVAALDLFLDAETKNLTPDSRLVIAQSALEGLGSGWPFPPLPNSPIVPQCQSEAANKIIQIALSLGLPIDIPSELIELCNLAHPKQQSDPGAEKITWVRNSIAHLGKYPRLKGKKRVTFQAFQFAIWHLELALLRLLDAQGLYSNRITALVIGTAEKLPWVP